MNPWTGLSYSDIYFRHRNTFGNNVIHVGCENEIEKGFHNVSNKIQFERDEFDLRKEPNTINSTISQYGL